MEIGPYVNNKVFSQEYAHVAQGSNILPIIMEQYIDTLSK